MKTNNQKNREKGEKQWLKYEENNKANSDLRMIRKETSDKRNIKQWTIIPKNKNNEKKERKKNKSDEEKQIKI